MSSGSNPIEEGSRMDQMEAMMKQMAEQLQALTTAVAGMTPSQPTPHAGEVRDKGKGPMRYERDTLEEIQELEEEEVIEYAARKTAKTQTERELQELKEQMQKVAQTMKSKNEDLLDFKAMAFGGQLPSDFKMPDMAKFDGTGDPKAHMRQYVSMMTALGLTEQQALGMFYMSLKGAPVVWYHNLDKKIREDWRALAEAFLAQYVTDMEIDVSLRDLENTRQKMDENFKEYVDRWRGQLLRMQTRPSEQDQIKMIIKGTKPSIYNKLRRMTSVISNFRQLKETVMDLEEEEAENKKSNGQEQYKKNSGGSLENGASKVNIIQKRHFSDMGRPLDQVLEELMMQGLLKPLDPQQKPLTKYGNPAYYCAYHQFVGHETERCARLRHEIQDLIDAGTIPNPE